MSEHPRVKLTPDFIAATAEHAHDTLWMHVNANFERTAPADVAWMHQPAELRSAWAAMVREVTGELLTELQRLGHLKEGLHV